MHSVHGAGMGVEVMTRELCRSCHGIGEATYLVASHDGTEHTSTFADCTRCLGKGLELVTPREHRAYSRKSLELAIKAMDRSFGKVSV